MRRIRYKFSWVSGTRSCTISAGFQAEDHVHWWRSLIAVRDAAKHWLSSHCLPYPGKRLLSANYTEGTKWSHSFRSLAATSGHGCRSSSGVSFSLTSGSSRVMCVCARTRTRVCVQWIRHNINTVSWWHLIAFLWWGNGFSNHLVTRVTHCHHHHHHHRQVEVRFTLM